VHRDRSVDSAVLGVSSTIRGLLIGADRDEVFTRHQVGRILQDVKRRPNAYGEQSIERIAEEVGQSPAMLYRYIAIAEQWSEADIKVEMARENRFGHPPSWSHFVVLLAVADSGIRRQLLKDCLKSSWTVRELRRRVNELSERKLRSADARGAGRPVNAALGEGIQTGNRAAMDVTIFAEALGSRLGDPEEPVDEDLLARRVIRARLAFDSFRHHWKLHYFA